MGRRLGVAALLCGAMLGLPLLLLQTQTAHASHASRPTRHRARAVRIASTRAAAWTCRRTWSRTTRRPRPPPRRRCLRRPPRRRCRRRPRRRPCPPPTPRRPCRRAPPPPPTTTTTAPAAVAAPPPAHSEVGEATWYSAAPAGMCASPSLPFGTVLTVTNDATGASTTCTVDDRESRATRGRGHVACGLRADRRPSEGVVKSQSPGDPFRCGHHRAARGAWAPPEPGPGSELRRRRQHRPAHRPPRRRRAGLRRPRDRRRPGLADPGAGRDGGTGRGGRDGPPPGAGARDVVEPVGVEVVEATR